MTAFSTLEFTQNLLVQSLFVTKTTSEHNGLSDCSINPSAFISLINFSFSFVFDGGTRRGACLMGKLSRVKMQV